LAESNETPSGDALLILHEHGHRCRICYHHVPFALDGGLMAEVEGRRAKKGPVNSVEVPLDRWPKRQLHEDLLLIPFFLLAPRRRVFAGIFGGTPRTYPFR
jgi:hypothetical protein